MNELPVLPKVIKTFGNSMFPFFINGDVLYLKKIGFPKIQVNDIVTVKQKDYYITHRVIYKGRNYLITKGDNSHFLDKKVYAKDIAGIVSKIKRQGLVMHPEQLYLFQSTLYFREIVKIKNTLAKNKIEMLFLKGLPLHLYFDKTHPRRMYADCDILINPKDFPKIKSLLKKFGYKKVEDKLSEKHKNLRNKESEVSYAKTLNGFQVVFDVHFEIVFLMTQLGELNSLYPQAKINLLTEDFMKKKRIIKVLGEEFPILSPENLLIYLCLHLFHHNFKGAYRYDFIDKIIKNDKTDYRTIIEVLKKYNLQNFVYPSFILLIKFYNSHIDKKMLAEIRPDKKTVGYITEHIVNADIFTDEERIGSGIKRFKTIFYLSPKPLLRKIFVFLNPEVIYSVLWVFYKKLLPTESS